MPATFRRATPAAFRISATLTIATDNKTDLFCTKTAPLSPNNTRNNILVTELPPRKYPFHTTPLEQKSAPINKHNQRATGKCITK